MASKARIQPGRVVGSVIVVDDPADLEEGSTVTVVSGDPDEVVDVADEERRELLERDAACDRGEVLDARAFLSELRREGATDSSR